DKTIPIPYYYQVQQRIKEAIKKGEWKSGQFIPTERDLSDKFQVSRITTRKALESLSIEGVIRKIKGKGATVAKPKIEGQLFNRLIGTYQDLKDKGFKITNKILDFKIIEPKESARKELNLLPKEKVYRFERIRFLDNEPYHYSKTFMTEKICPNFVYKLLIKNSLIKVLEESYELKIYRVRRVLEAGVASMEDSKLFKIKIGAPILAFYNTAFLKDGTPIEYTLNKIRGDMSKFDIEISLEGVEDIKHNIKNN
ncbi:MAG: GntR family transcriptional regulator, partial [Actinobacteria bacterium]|nr:GntR family transcriptional regulator [Actinomycetota bacterium]